MPNPSEKAPEIERIVCALILGSDHPLTLNEIQKILADVEADDRKEQLESAEPISDDEFEAIQAAADDAASAGAEAGAPAPAPAPEPEKFALEAAEAQPQAIPIGELCKVVVGLQRKFHELDCGFELVEVSGGYRFQTASDCGKWVRKMLNKGKPTSLSRPAIETLAIIAYRQPVARSEIESIRGVSASHVIKALMEMQLVRIIGRSDLPGRPFLFGTTPAFLDHFGLKSLKDLEPIKT
ncbi:MAG: SMC-Scp complex subunit ScpB [Kiritimatiellia bacterium]